MKGILVTPELIPAIADGIKTVTRRLMNPQPTFNDGVWDWQTGKKQDLVGLSSNLKAAFCQALVDFARYKVGDVVYIKEGWESDCTCGNPKCNGVIYKLRYAGVIMPDKWRSPLFMPAWAARYFIKMLDVRVELFRLASLTPAELDCEGGEPALKMLRKLDGKWVFCYQFKKLEQ